jgi:hypothetical protein
MHEDILFASQALAGTFVAMMPVNDAQAAFFRHCPILLLIIVVSTDLV